MGHLLRWWRFLWALDIEWDRAVREDARDFMLWMQLADEPVRVHWRRRDAPVGGETVLWTFYDFHLASNSVALLINPFPLDRSRRLGRANAHHNPMEDFKAQPGCARLRVRLRGDEPPERLRPRPRSGPRAW
ncbi:hypothetical protein ACFWBI_39195 [Streptomyces sp. NPDC059982]|uniref:hypothetical protein n=1 Tax=unclassified Streptomyces TaxID=2593676 RepID=UPI0036A9CBC1